MGREHELPWAAVRRLLKQGGADIVAKNAVKHFAEWLENFILDLAENAVAVMKNNGRKTLYYRDIKLAIRFLNK